MQSKRKISAYFETRYSIISEGEGDYREKIFFGLRDLNAWDFKRGCPFANIVQEMSNIDDDFNITMKNIYIKYRQSIQAIFNKAVSVGELRTCDTAKLALFTASALEGAVLSAKASSDPQDYIDSVECLIGYICHFESK